MDRRQIDDHQVYDALHKAACGLDSLDGISAAGRTALTSAVQALNLIAIGLVAAEVTDGPDDQGDQSGD